METMSPEKVKDMELRIVEAIKEIFDPEIPINIYELGLIYELEVSPFANVYCRMTLTSPNCPVAGSLPGEVQQKIRDVEGVQEVDLELTFDPPWSQDMLSEEAKLELGFM